MTLIKRDIFAEALSLNKLGLRSLTIPLMKILKIQKINRLYDSVKHVEGIDFADKVLKELKVSFHIPENDLKNIPASGPVIFIANHPYGGLDGIILVRILAEARPDLKVMANFIMKHVEPLQDFFLPVDPFEMKNSTQRSLGGVKATLEHLSQGKSIGIFPAGEVSSFQKKSRKIVDKAWSPMVGKLISKSRASVVPIYFSGTNSLLFHLLGLIHPRLRTAWLPTELLNKKHHTVKVRIGKPIPATEIQSFDDNFQLLRFLRAKTYALGSTVEVKRSYFKLPVRKKADAEPIIDPVETHLIEQEIAKLRCHDRLVEMQDYELFLASSNKIPNILREIGRLREITFRDVGEGTNMAIDVDEYDLYYHHLFIWDRSHHKIIGAYRVGKGQELYNTHGVKGFYINTLFQMSRRFYPILRQSVELGRSFIIKEYQQRIFILFLLWRGLLIFMKSNPEYRYLLGPVSISNKFHKVSKALLVYYIKKHFYDHELAKMIKARKAFKVKKSYIDAEIIFGNEKEASMKKIDDVISELEPMNDRVPVLIKKYIKQNGKIIGFNIDPDFNNSLDGFIIMDITQLPEETMQLLEKPVT